MFKTIIIGIGAGFAAALLFAAVATGTMIAFPLFLLAPLPIALATFNWGWMSGAAAALASSAALLVTISLPVGAAFAVLFALPIVWISYLAGLSRPGSDPAQPGLREWYPLGRILLQAACGVAAAVIIVGFLIGYDVGALARELTEAFTQVATADPGALPMSVENIGPVARFTVALMPYTATALALVILVFNAWLAARLTALSGRLQRPWTPLWTATLPSWFVAIFVGGVIIAFVPGWLGHAGAAVAGASGFAFALVGVAVLHALSRGKAGRNLLLALGYLVVVLFGISIVLAAFVGIADSYFHFRSRPSPGLPTH